MSDQEVTVATLRDAPEPRAKCIPIEAARRISQDYGYDQVVIFARKHGENGTEHVTTYGKTTDDCDVAARMGNHLKRVVGWPESKCQEKPARIRKREAKPVPIVDARAQGTRTHDL